MSKKRELTELQEKFLDALRDKSNKGDLKTCMTLAGYSDTIPVSYIIKSLSEEIVDVTLELIAAESTKAAIAIVGVLDSPSGLDRKNTLEAAKQILDRAGVVKKEKQNLELSVGSGLVILPAKDVPKKEDE